MAATGWILDHNNNNITSVNVTSFHPKGDDMCMDRFSWIGRSGFIHRSCTMCYHYLFQRSKTLQVYGQLDQLAVKGNESLLKESVYPDPRNKSIMDWVCDTLDSGECVRWTACCESAVKCCDDQIAAGSDTGMVGSCPRVWDGYSCWWDTAPGMLVTQSCPWYINHAVTTSKY